MKKRVFTAAVGDPDRLGALLEARLGLGAAEAGALVAAGSVYVGDQRASDPAEPVRAGSPVKVFAVPATEPFTLVFSDENLIVVDKPCGLPSQETRAAKSSLASFVQARFSDARLLHRLDREVSGLVLFARAKSTERLQALLDARKIRRGYVALIAGTLEGEGEIRLRIARHPRDVRLRQALAEDAHEGQAACTRYRALDDSLVELVLETGRTHQIRVHLAAIDHPIVGDTVYGGPPASRLLLHAHTLALPAGVCAQALFESPLPSEFRVR